MADLTRAQQRYLAEIRAAGPAGRVYNDRARQPLVALETAGLITVDWDMTSQTKGSGMELVGHNTAVATPQLAFCEPINAVPMGKWPLRVVGPEGLKLGGGIPNLALCERDVRRGWDLEMPATPENIATLARPRSGDGHVWLCPECATAAERDLR